MRLTESGKRLFTTSASILIDIHINLRSTLSLMSTFSSLSITHCISLILSLKDNYLFGVIITYSSSLSNEASLSLRASSTFANHSLFKSPLYIQIFSFSLDCENSPPKLISSIADQYPTTINIAAEAYNIFIITNLQKLTTYMI